MLVWFLIGRLHGSLAGIAIISMVFCFVCGHGFVNPDGMALALEPFTRNAGSAAAMMGCMQMVAGALATGLISYLHNGTPLPMICGMILFTSISLMIMGGVVLLRR